MRECLIIIVILPLLISLACKREVSTSPEDVLISNNQLFVDSNPKCAAIFIDQKNTGQYTPDTIKWIVTGDHIITLKKKLFEDFSLPVSFSENEVKSLFFDYTTNPLMFGRLYIDSEPRGANIYLNDTSTGFKTPQAFNDLFPGEYKVGYKLTGFWDLETSISVVSNSSITVDKRLIDTSKWVNYNSSTVGLETNYFNSVDIQSGYVKWFGSNDKGLLRYDDNEWIFYNTLNSSIPSNKVLSVNAIDNGVWIGTDYGAAYFGGGQWQIYNSSNSPLESDQIECITIDPAGKVWMATFNKGVYVLNGGTWTNYNSSNSPLPTDFINSIYAESNGTIWIGTYGSGLVRFDGTNWTVFSEGLLPSSNVKAIFVHNAVIWAGCHNFGLLSGGIASMINNAWTLHQPYNTFSITADINGSIWFGTDGSGLLNYNGAGWYYYNVLNSGILSNKVTGIAIDGAGNKWLSTFGGGISKYKMN